MEELFEAGDSGRGCFLELYPAPLSAFGAARAQAAPQELIFQAQKIAERSGIGLATATADELPVDAGRINQSGGHCYYGSITRQGPPWLRWILTEAAIRIVRRDAALKNMYDRIRKRAGSKKARIAIVRKLAYMGAPF